MKRVLLWFFFASCLLNILSSCQELVPIWKGGEALDGYVLSQDSSACTLDLKIDSLAPIMYVRLDLEIKYDTYTGRNSLPLQMAFQDTTGNFDSFTKVNIPIRKNERWLGYPYKRNKEYIILHTALEKMKIHPGSYSLHIFADNKDLSFLPGIIDIQVRIYRV